MQNGHHRLIASPALAEHMTGHEPTQPSGDVAAIGIVGGEDVLAGWCEESAPAAGPQSWPWRVICYSKGDDLPFRIQAEARAALRTNV